MMTNDDYRHFVCIVAGDEPDKLMEKYDINKKVEPYVVYKFKDAEKIKNSMLLAYEQQMKELDEDDYELDELQETYDYVSGLSPEDAFKTFTYYYDKDPVTGDAISNENPDGRWDSYNIGKLFSTPFYTKNGIDTYQCKKCDIDWSVMHGSGIEFYKKVWNMVMNGDKPENKKEENAYENMKDRKYYFEKFETIETYVASNTSFWGYAFLSEDTGWKELKPSENQFKWMINYYTDFIEKLPDNTLLTIYECRRI